MDWQKLPLETLTVPLLKEELRAQGLTVSGRKDELIERLRGLTTPPRTPAVLALTRLSPPLGDVPVSPRPIYVNQPTQSPRLAQAVRPVQPALPVQPAQPVRPAQPALIVQPVQPAQPVRPVQPALLVQPAQPVRPAQPALPLQQTQPVQLVRPIQQTQPFQPAQLPPQVQPFQQPPPVQLGPQVQPAPQVQPVVTRQPTVLIQQALPVQPALLIAPSPTPVRPDEYILAARTGNLAIIDRVLAERQVDPLIYSNQALKEAILYDHPDVVERLLPYLQVAPHYYQELLEVAAVANKPNALTYLLQSNPSPSLQPTISMLLTMAALNQRPDLIEVLLRDPRATPGSPR